MIIAVVEGFPDITHEDSGMAMIATICPASSGPTGVFVRVQSWNESADRCHPIEEQLRDKRVRVTVEAICGICEEWSHEPQYPRDEPATLARLRAFCVDQMAPDVDGNLTNCDTIWPSEVLAILDGEPS